MTHRKHKEFMRKFPERGRHNDGEAGGGLSGRGRSHHGHGRPGFRGGRSEEEEWGLESGRGGEFGRGGGRHRKRLFSGDELKLLILRLIAREPRHGYDLIREIAAMSGNSYTPSPGVIYPTLTLMTEMGYLTEQVEEGARKRFAITAEGHVWLEENKAIVQAVMERLEALAENVERLDAAPLRRAMQNLSMAVRARLHKEGADEETLFDVAALIDEAASKIERLK